MEVMKMMGPPSKGLVQAHSVPPTMPGPLLTHASTGDTCTLMGKTLMLDIYNLYIFLDFLDWSLGHYVVSFFTSYNILYFNVCFAWNWALLLQLSFGFHLHGVSFSIFFIPPYALLLERAHRPVWCHVTPWTSSEGQMVAFSLLQCIFPTQGSNRGLLHCRWILYQLSYQGSPSIVLLSVYVYL